MAKEKHLRAWIRHHLPEALFVEPAVGSTFGVPDVLYPFRKQLIPIELKVFVNGFEVKLRSSQRKTLARLETQKVRTYVAAVQPDLDNVARDMATTVFITRGSLILHDKEREWWACKDKRDIDQYLIWEMRNE